MTPAEEHALRGDAIAEGLVSRRVGRQIVILPVVDSTNSYALNVLARETGLDADGAAVFAERQTQGRGRLGRQWHCPAGAGLTFSVLLFEGGRATLPAYWMALGAVAVVRGIEAATDVCPMIRWPNDVYAGERKLAGILVEAAWSGSGPSALALGVGINCLQQRGHFPPDIAGTATSLELESRQAISRTAVARAVLAALDECVHEGEGEISAKWLARSDDLGRHVALVHDGATYRGRIVDVHPKDGLVLQLDAGGRRIFDPATTSRVQALR